MISCLRSSQLAQSMAASAALYVLSALPAAAARVPERQFGSELSIAVPATLSGITADGVVSRAIAAMKTVKTVRSNGVFGGQPVQSTFTGVCVTSGPAARMSVHSARNRWQIILLSKPKQRDWIRYRRPSAPWGRWEPQATGAGDFNFPLLLPLGCPRLSLHDWRLNKATLHFRVSGVASVGGRQAWHLHASVRGASGVTTVDWYLDRSTYRLLRRQFIQFNAAGKPGYAEDVTYSGFNRRVTVLPPKS